MPSRLWSFNYLIFPHNDMTANHARIAFEAMAGGGLKGWQSFVAGFLEDGDWVWKKGREGFEWEKCEGLDDVMLG